MTKERLSRLYYIKKEICMWEEKLHELDLEAQGEAIKITGMPVLKGSCSDKTGNIAVKKVDIKKKIEEKKIDLEKEYKAIMEYILSIDDSFIRQIMYYRYVECYTWQKVAYATGSTAESVRKIHGRYLKRVCEKSDIQKAKI